MEIRVAGIIRESIVDGPGLRFSLFTQGCPHHCEGCHNPDSHSPTGGQLSHTERIFEEYKKNPYLTGLTLTGGEPIMQAEACAELARLVRSVGGNVLLFSGYTFEQLLEMSGSHKGIMELLKECFLLVDGPFQIEEKDLSLPLSGSRNQRVLDLQQSLEQGRAVEYQMDWVVSR